MGYNKYIFDTQHIIVWFISFFVLLYDICKYVLLSLSFTPKFGTFLSQKWTAPFEDIILFAEDKYSSFFDQLFRLFKKMFALRNPVVKSTVSRFFSTEAAPKVIELPYKVRIRFFSSKNSRRMYFHYAVTKIFTFFSSFYFRLLVLLLVSFLCTLKLLMEIKQ